MSIAENRIINLKDGDFYDSYTGRKEPYKLLQLKTGNISNAKLLEVFERNLSAILAESAQNPGFSKKLVYNLASGLQYVHHPSKRRHTYEITGCIIFDCVAVQRVC